MRTWLLLAAFFELSCDSFSESNPLYCDHDATCTGGMTCDLAHHHCATSTGAKLLSASPAIGKRAGGSLITLTGQDFSADMQVNVNGTVVPANLVSSTQLTFTLPAAPMLCGPVPIRVQRSDGQAIDGTVQFRYRYTNLGMALDSTLVTVSSSASAIAAADA